MRGADARTHRALGTKRANEPDSTACISFFLDNWNEQECWGDSVSNFYECTKKHTYTKLAIGNEVNKCTGAKEWANAGNVSLSWEHGAIKNLFGMGRSSVATESAWWGPARFPTKKWGQYMATKCEANNQKLTNKHYGCNSRLCQMYEIQKN